MWRVHCQVVSFCPWCVHCAICSVFPRATFFCNLPTAILLDKIKPFACHAGPPGSNWQNVAANASAPPYNQPAPVKAEPVWPVKPEPAWPGAAPVKPEPVWPGAAGGAPQYVTAGQCLAHSMFMCCHWLSVYWGLLCLAHELHGQDRLAACQLAYAQMQAAAMKPLDETNGCDSWMVQVHLGAMWQPLLRALMGPLQVSTGSQNGLERIIVHAGS